MRVSCECCLNVNEWAMGYRRRSVRSPQAYIATTPLLPNCSGEGTRLVSLPYARISDAGRRQVNLVIGVSSCLLIPLK